MSDSRPQLVKKIFQEAAELSGKQRHDYLTDRCGSDVNLRDEVEKLLGWDSSVHTKFLEGSSHSETQRPIPQRIAHFQILRLIGEGGMGSVFEAQQDHPRRVVALKVIRMAMASESVRRRFEYEVQILGQLKHPGIAQIYEAGTHDDGMGPLPYFAMEFIQGPSLLQFAKGKALSTRQRLSLFAEICDAVHHAHQKGVVHRDLKPANILVETDGGSPQPKILDFGVARATHSDVQQVTMHTEVGQIIGTLSYMSPEQVAGRPDELDVRSDVYALGVILYELLADRLPYDLRGHSLPEAGNIIRDQEPSRLSSVHSAFRGDVETIVAKALEKEKERRYQSAAELGEDIRRFLRDEPIVARPASRAYQIRKFAKRNKEVVVALAAVFVSLILGIIGTTVALVRATHAEAIATQRSEDSHRSAAKATAVNTFLQEMLSSVDPAKSLGKEVTIRDALDQAASKIDSGSMDNQPELEAELRTTIGNTLQALGHYPEAEVHLRKALALRKQLFGDVHSDVASSLSNLSLVLNSQGRFPESEQLMRESLAIAEKLHGPNHLEVATVKQSLGAALRSQRKYDEAERQYQGALTIRREMLGPDHVDVAQSTNSLGLLAQNRSDYAHAEELFRDALRIRRAALGEIHPLIADSLNNLANLLVLRDNWEEAERLHDEALEMRRRLLGPDHPQLAQSLNSVALVLLEKGKYAKAESLEREALAIWKKTLPPGHLDIANGGAVLTLTLLGAGKYEEAESTVREVLAIREAGLPEGHWMRFSSMSALGASLAGQRRFSEAEPLLISAYEGLKDQANVQASTKQIALRRIVQMYEGWDKSDEVTRWRALESKQLGK